MEANAKVKKSAIRISRSALFHTTVQPFCPHDAYYASLKNVCEYRDAIMIFGVYIEMFLFPCRRSVLPYRQRVNKDVTFVSSCSHSADACEKQEEEQREDWEH